MGAYARRLNRQQKITFEAMRVAGCAGFLTLSQFGDVEGLVPNHRERVLSRRQNPELAGPPPGAGNAALFPRKLIVSVDLACKSRPANRYISQELGLILGRR
jgi:hypothetical protein